MYAGYVAMHLACLGAFGIGVSRTDLALCFISYSSAFGFSHKAFTATRGTLTGASSLFGHAAGHALAGRAQFSIRTSHSGWFLDKNNRDADYSSSPTS